MPTLYVECLVRRSTFRRPTRGHGVPHCTATTTAPVQALASAARAHIIEFSLQMSTALAPTASTRTSRSMWLLRFLLTHQACCVPWRWSFPPGKLCPLFMRLGKYIGLQEIYASLSSGMTPVISYWRSKTMGWLDGAGPDGLDCGIERPGQCRESVKFYGFSLSDYVPRPAPTPAPQVFATPAPNPWGQPVSQPQPAWVPSLRAPATPVPTPAPQPAVAPSMKMLPGAYPWAEVTRDGSVYYYNVVTQEVTWTLPGAIFT